jgi:hypothetical protein
MPADFQTFQDTTLVNIGVAEVDFDTANVDGSQRANLSFAVIPSVAAGQDVTLEVQCNTEFILQETFTSADQRVLHKNFDASILGRHNTLTLIKAGGLGEISLGNFMVNFKTRAAWSTIVAQAGNTEFTWTISATSLPPPSTSPLSTADTIELSFFNGSPIKIVEVLRSLGPNGLSGPVFEVTVAVVGASFTTYAIRGGIIL